MRDSQHTGILSAAFILDEQLSCLILDRLATSRYSRKMGEENGIFPKEIGFFVVFLWFFVVFCCSIMFHALS